MHSHAARSDDFDLFVASVPGRPDANIPIAGARAGGIGVLNLCHVLNYDDAEECVDALVASVPQRCGLIFRSPLTEFESRILNRADAWQILLLAPRVGDEGLQSAILACREKASRVGVVVTDVEQARSAVDAGADLLVAKGHEAGGFVGEETTFVLVQRLTAAFGLPIIAWGGIGWNTAAACRAAGCAGVMLDWQFALTRESALPLTLRRRLASVDGSETFALPISSGRYVRFFSQPGFTAKDRLESIVAAAERVGESPAEKCHLAISESLASPKTSEAILLTGQDVGFAPSWAARATSTGRLVRKLHDTLDEQVAAAAKAQSLSQGSPLAKSHGTEFPLVQGPMTRVSDVPEFCEAVGLAGGLPFLALALMGEEQVRRLLSTTKERMGDRPWGVGILGFVPQEIRAQQWPVIEEYCPPYAIIAGGRPDQAASLEARGIATYLHVPSPGMLEMFIQDGARRFIFEGRECGGHVGPRTSFVLWETMVRVLAESSLSPEECAKIHVLFAGGIHDGLGAAMVATLAQPLVERGMQIGALMGTAYLFTHEAVATGAIVPAFQSICLTTNSSVVVESGPGHSIRCADTDFVRVFAEEKRRLIDEKWPAEDVRSRLEHLNLGRLRIAAKGVARSSPQQAKLLELDEAEQRSQGMYMLGQVASLRAEVCAIRHLHESVCGGATALLDKLKSSAPKSLPVAKSPRPLDLAIVGMSCLVPGADSPAKLWHNILAKHDPISEIPADRFDHTQWFDVDRTARDRIYSKWGGFIPDITFDPIKYGIPPASLRSIEPMQLLALELVARVLRDAGYDEVNPHRERTSVILGVGGGSGELGASYSFRAMAPRYLHDLDESIWSQLPEWTEDSFAGILLNVVAGRISNRFDLGGMNCTVDAACASSLAAVYAGAQELSTGNSDMVIVGGCDTIQNSMGYLCFATAGALSPTGRARVFDASADGIVISEGHGAIVLKRREDAERDGDKVYAVLRGIAAGSDGRSKGLSAPRLEGQIRTLRRTYERAGIDPKSIGLFEAHGTGTAVGDQTECLALTTFLKESGANPSSAAIGSVKSGIGHTKCAAGVIGVIKTALALHHRVLPPTMHVEQPNAKAGFGDGALYVNSETRPWLHATGPRRAGVSSFGFGGTNFHAILEEHTSGNANSRATLREHYASELIAFSADNLPVLLVTVSSFVRDLSAAIAAEEQIPLHRVAYGQHLKHGALGGRLRLAVVASEAADLLAKLQHFVATCSDSTPATMRMPPGIHFAMEPLGPTAPVAVLFPGQGSQFPNMLRDLAVEFVEVSSCFERASRALSPILEQSIFELVFPPPSFTDGEKEAQAERLKATRFAQPALGVCDIAMWRLLHAFGVRADFMAGHSYGELAALCAAGCMTESDLIKLSAARGSAMTSTSDDDSVRSSPTNLGQMLAASADGNAVKPHLAGLDDVWVANLNGPRQTVISGTAEGIAAASRRLTEANITTRLLPVAAAFHSPLMHAARERFDHALSQTGFTSPRIPVYSNVTAEQHSADGDSMRSLLGDQLQHEVRFAEEIDRMYRDGARIFIEAGPKSVLTSLVRDILGDRPHVAIATQPSATSGVTAFLDSLAGLIAQGVNLNLDRLYDDRTIEPLKLGAPTGVKKHPPHAWLVNGAYCRPAGESPRVPTPKASLAAGGMNGSHRSPVSTNGLSDAHLTARGTSDSHSNREVKSRDRGANTNGNSFHREIVTSNLDHTNNHDLAMNHRANSEVQSIHAESYETALSAGQESMDLEAYALFQETMRQFLETQERVMRYQFGTVADSIHNNQGDHQIDGSARTQPLPLSQRSDELEPSTRMRSAQSKSELSAPIPEVLRESKEITSRESGLAPAAEEAPAPKHATPSLEKESTQSSASRDETLQRWLNTLLKIVEDRTGYPIDMLDPDAVLEADLGIDSIKRVEIIAAFRCAELDALPELPANLMERLTG
ncbi:MAG TPA: beta-ketoacyl synthase N-terminal-like domain-containing protein, partial [Lacipirellulaceae bacterium]|nr:beta-ketoacyl synthase N-terminal-like domain-containing protein [Lacipirellulaceae bacterium]